MDTTHNNNRETAASDRDIRCPACGEPWDTRTPGPGGPHYTVRLTRPDGSRTYKGSRLRPSQAAREAAAWEHLHQGYKADMVDERDPAVQADIAAWKKAITNAYRYFPA